jgi:hypothetical protein
MPVSGLSKRIRQSDYQKLRLLLILVLLILVLFILVLIVINPLCHGDGLRGMVGFFIYRQRVVVTQSFLNASLSEQKVPNLSERCRLRLLIAFRW